MAMAAAGAGRASILSLVRYVLGDTASMLSSSSS
jgi:hypothetical protein